MGKDKVKPSLGIIGVDHGGVSIYSILYIYYIYYIYILYASGRSAQVGYEESLESIGQGGVINAS